MPSELSVRTAKACSHQYIKAPRDIAINTRTPQERIISLYRPGRHTNLSETKVDVAEARIASPHAGGADHVGCLQDLSLRVRSQPSEALLICCYKLTLFSAQKRTWTFGKWAEG